MANINETLLTDIAHKGDFVSTATGDLDTISGLNNLKNALFHRLMTSPGAWVHLPDYGVGILDYQNAPSSFAIQQRLAMKIKEQFEQDSRVESVDGVSLTYDDLTPSLCILTIRITVAGYGDAVMQYTPFSEGA